MTVILSIFYVLILAFIMAASAMFIPVFGNDINFAFLAVPGILMFIFGILLIVLARRKKLDKKLKKYLIITGASASGIFLGSILHNFFYALAEISKNIKIISLFMQFLEISTFVLALFVCPIVFIISAAFVNILLIRKRKKLHASSA